MGGAESAPPPWPQNYGEVLGPLDLSALPAYIREACAQDESLRDWVLLSERVMRAEKISSWTEWTPEQRAAYARGDSAEFSRLRGYTDQEIEDFGRWMRLARGLAERFDDDFPQAVIHELWEAMMTPELEEIESRLREMSRRPIPA